MKTWTQYTHLLSTGEWHIHTNYTDGKSTIHEYCERAELLGIPLLAFTEHVREKLNYDFNDFLSEIDTARDNYTPIILSGCECKVLPGGELDVDPSILTAVDYPIIGFHSFPEDIELYYTSLKSALRNPHIETWAHPGLFSRKINYSFELEKLKEIYSIMKENRVALEINKKYHVPPTTWLHLAKEYKIGLIRGSDVHHTNELSV